MTEKYLLNKTFSGYSQVLMNRGFWTKLKKPFSISAPLAGVSDFPFREILSEIGKPDVVYTEMVTTEGLAAKGEAEFALQMKYGEKERPIVAQIFGSDPKKVEAAARIAAERGFDGVDINMGCPQDVITRQGSGAALIKTPELAIQLIEAARAGAGNVPVSVKTRTGWINHGEAAEWMEKIASAKPVAITLHGRTRAMKGKGLAAWDVIEFAAGIIRSIDRNILIIGNGDVVSAKDGERKAASAGVCGFMIGRAAIGNPWVFSGEDPSPSERLETLLKHTDLFVETFGERSFDRLKSHYSGYVSGFIGARELREEVVRARHHSEAKEIVVNFLKKIDK